MTDPVIIGAVCFFAGALAGAALECYCLFDKTTELIVAENGRLKQRVFDLTIRLGMLRVHVSNLENPIEGLSHVAARSEAALSGEYDGAGLS